MSTTSYSAQLLLANLLEVTMATPTWPTQWFVAASTTEPTFAKGSAPYWNFTEPTDPAYARQLASWQVGGYQPPTAYSQEPTASVTFPTASQSWGTITYLGVFDALSGGNLWFFIPMVRTTSDGVLTAGSTTVSSATMAFTSSDIGQVISGQGIPIGATILSQTGTACVISAEAEVSATGVVLTVGTPKVVSASESLTMPVGSLLVELG